MAGINNTNTPSNKGPEVTSWEINAKGSTFKFISKMRLMFLFNVKVVGHFSDVKGIINFDERDPTRSSGTITIGTTSLDTKMASRDKHLRSNDFFGVEEHPTMTFTVQSIETLEKGTEHYRVKGNLKIRNVSREVSLDAHKVSTGTESDKSKTFKLAGVINRADFGITWKRPIQQIEDEINLDLTVQFVRP